MRNSMKKLVSSIFAVMMTVSMSTTAFAADYGQEPSFSSTPSQSSSATKEEVNEAVEEAVDNAIANATEASEGSTTASVEVKSVKNLSVSAATVKKLAESGVALEIVSPDATITIAPDTIKKARKLDLSVKVVNSSSKTKLDFSSKKALDVR